MKKNKLIYFVVGASPNFIKAAPLINQIEKDSIFEFKLIHTGQHYDKLMSEIFFEDLKIRNPDYNFDVNETSQNSQIANIMLLLEEKCSIDKPDLIFVFGDVNSTLAASITAKKMNISLIHYEAGLRSNDRKMPEEINRLMCDSVSDYFLCTEETGVKNLLSEGKEKKNIFLVGNLMIDSLFEQLKNTKINKIKDYAVLTMHRPSNVDNPNNLKKLITTINLIAKKIEIIFPVHPRTILMLNEFQLDENIKLIKPLGYKDFCNLWSKSKFVITDSGGIQEETTALKIPCITIRENTERPITLEVGSNSLVGFDQNRTLKFVDQILNNNYKQSTIPKFWDGSTSKRIIKILNKIL